MWQITINGPGYFDTSYELGDGITTLGRGDDNDIVLSGDLVSRKHARIHVKQGTVRLEDLESRNGSRINGRGVQGIHDLRAGDLIAVGENTMTLRPVQHSNDHDRDETDPHTQALAFAGGVRMDADKRDIKSAVIYSRKVKESAVLRALDNVFPFSNEDALKGAPVNTDPGIGTPTPAPGVAAPAPTYEAMALLYKVVESLANASHLQAFLDSTTELVMHAIHATTGVVLLRGPDGELQPASVHHRGAALHQGEVPVSHAIVNEALAQGAALILADVRGDKRFAKRDSVVLYDAGQVLCIPLGGREPYAGVLYLNRPSGQTTGLEPLVDLCTAVAHLMATGVEKFSLQNQAPAPSRLQVALERAHAPDTVKKRLQDYGRAGHPLMNLEERVSTVLFADLSGFSALSRKLEPKDLTELLNEFYTRMTNILFSFEGTVATFVGDSVLGIFGAPYPKGDDAARAVRAALALRLDWQKLMMKRPTSDRCQLKVGLHTGNVLAGTVGTERRLEYAVVGEPVNLAAWLVGLAGPDQVLITGRTRSAVGNRFEVSSLGERSIHAGGKDKIALFEVLEEDLGVNTNPGVQSV